MPPPAVLTAVAAATFAAAAFAAAGCAPAGEGGPGTHAAPRSAPADGLPLWEARYEGRVVHLLGSVHLLGEDVYPLDPAIGAAYEAADVLVLELDYGEAAAAAPLLMQRGTLPDGQTLADVLPPDLLDEVEARLAALSIPPAFVAEMEPWLLAMTLSSVALQQEDLEAAVPLDLHFHDRARADGTPIRALETVAEQIEMFDGLGREAQLAYLRSALDQLDGVQAELAEGTALWQRRDVEGLAALYVQAIGDQSELLERILHDRNRAWAAEIQELLERGQTALVVLGIGHLAGESGVVELLRRRGVDVARVPPSGPAVPDAPEAALR